MHLPRTLTKGAVDSEPGKREYNVRPLSIEYSDSVYALHEEIYQSQVCSHQYRDFDRAFFFAHCESEGKTFGAFHGQNLVGIAVVRFPRGSSDNLGYELGLSCADRQALAHLELCAIRREHRGEGLQRLLSRARMNLSLKMGFRKFATTIAPNNVYSLKNHLDEGLHLCWFGKKYGGFERFILYKNVDMENVTFNSEVLIPLADLEQIKQFIGGGFVGCDLLDSRRVLKMAQPTYESIGKVGLE